MPLYIAQSGDLSRCHACLTDGLITLKDSATQLLIKYKSGPLVTQLHDQVNLANISAECSYFPLYNLPLCQMRRRVIKFPKPSLEK